MNTPLAWEWHNFSWCGVSAMRYHLMIKDKNSEEVDMEKLRNVGLCSQFVVILSIFVAQNVVLGVFFDAVANSSAIRILLYGVPSILPLLLNTFASCWLEKKLNTQIQPDPNNGGGIEEENGEGGGHNYNMFVYDGTNNNYENDEVINDILAANAEEPTNDDDNTQNDNERRAFRRSALTNLIFILVHLSIGLIESSPELRSTIFLLAVSLNRLLTSLFTLYNFRLVASLTSEYFAELKTALVERGQMWAERCRTMCFGNNEEYVDNAE